MALNYAYNYAVINVETGLCTGVRSSSRELSNPALIEISVYDENYVDKYYLNGNWYEDAAGTIPWTSSLL